jgi:hypothetical protein
LDGMSRIPDSRQNQATSCNRRPIPGQSPVTRSRIGMPFAPSYPRVLPRYLPPKFRAHAGMTDNSTQACFAVGLACARACRRCADACAAYPDRSELESVLRDCFTSCVLWLADLYEDKRPLRRSRLVCALACESCAIACERSQDEIFRACARECRRCAQHCR